MWANRNKRFQRLPAVIPGLGASPSCGRHNVGSMQVHGGNQNWESQIISVFGCDEKSTSQFRHITSQPKLTGLGQNIQFSRRIPHVGERDNGACDKTFCKVAIGGPYFSRRRTLATDVWHHFFPDFAWTPSMSSRLAIARNDRPFARSFLI